MTTIISTKAPENGTFVIEMSFTDEDGTAVAPSTLRWTLTDSEGNVINNRQDVNVTSLSSTIDVVLSGDDLAIQSNEIGYKTVERIFSVEGTYNSSIGTNLPLTGSCVFQLENFIGI